MIAEILSTGDEIRTGALVDSNSAYISRRLEALGVSVARHLSVGDDLDMIKSALLEIGNQADVAVVTGGLGPTQDDLSSEAAALAAGVPLKLDSEALRSIEAFFKSLKRPMSRSNAKQAMLPGGAERIDNPAGTAPGFSIRIGRAVFFFLPGVPHEMRRMLGESVLPRIQKLQGTERQFHETRTLSTFGLPESVAGERLEGMETEFPEIKIGLRAKFPEIQIKFYANGADLSVIRKRLDQAAVRAADRLGEKVFSMQGESLPAAVGRLLRKGGETLAAAESCTGGLISHWLTEVPGSSDYFLLSAVTYANAAKESVLSVRPETLERYGAVHEETVKEMAEGVRRLARASYGLATSGIAGPDGGTEDKPVGTVCVGLSTGKSVNGWRFFYPYGARGMKKELFAAAALDTLRREMEGKL